MTPYVNLPPLSASRLPFFPPLPDRLFPPSLDSIPLQHPLLFYPHLTPPSAYAALNLALQASVADSALKQGLNMDDVRLKAKKQMTTASLGL